MRLAFKKFKKLFCLIFHPLDSESDTDVIDVQGARSRICIIQGCRSHPFLKFPVPDPAPDKFRLWLLLLPRPIHGHTITHTHSHGCSRSRTRTHHTHHTHTYTQGPVEIKYLQ